MKYDFRFVWNIMKQICVFLYITNLLYKLPKFNFLIKHHTISAKDSKNKKNFQKVYTYLLI